MTDRINALARTQPVLEYPELELSSRLEEKSMRAVALGRQIWIHWITAGSLVKLEIPAEGERDSGGKRRWLCVQG
jgi:hypothetical protein